MTGRRPRREGGACVAAWPASTSLPSRLRRRQRLLSRELDAGQAQPATSKSPKFKAIIFGLDDTLADVTRLGDSFFDPAFDAMRRANGGRLADARLLAAFSACWHTSFDAVVQAYGFSSDMARAGLAAFGRLCVVEGATSYGGYSDLELVKHLPVMSYLVTSGFRSLQQSKIAALGIEGWFDRVVIDAIDGAKRRGKLAIFEDIRRAGNWNAREVLVVGSDPNQEIAVGNKLGMVTVQILRPKVECSGAAIHHILTLGDLWPLMGIDRHSSE